MVLFIMCVVNNISERPAYSNTDKALADEEFGAFIFEP